MRLIKLTPGKNNLQIFVKVDNSDFALLSSMTWYAFRNRNKFYAIRSKYDSKNKHRNYRIWMHRLLIGANTGEQVDHINGDTLDNRRCNLRICTHGQNIASRPRRIVNTSGFKGVWFHKRDKKWETEISINGRSLYLGRYDEAEEAYLSYCLVAHQVYGEFAHG